MKNTLEERVREGNEKEGRNNKNRHKGKVLPHEVITSTKRKEELTFLYLAELGFGTKAYDPLAMDGLAYFLKTGGIGKKIDAIIIQSGLIPRIPEYYSKLGAENMRFLSQLPQEKRGETLLKMVSKEDLPRDDYYYFKKYIEGKITTKKDATTFAKDELTKLAKVLKTKQWHYQEGEEDIENRDDLKEIKIIDYQNKEENLQRLQGVWADLTKKEKRLEERKGVLKEGLEEKKFKAKQKEYKAINAELDSYPSKKRDVQLKINAIKREMEASGFFAGIKRRNLTADREELLFRLTKREYQAALSETAPEGITLQLHSTSEKRIGARWGAGKIKKEEETEEPSFLKVKGLEILLMHNPNMRSSDVKMDTIAAQKDEIKFLNKLRKIYGDRLPNVPDVILSSHEAGGFRAQPQPKYTENLVQGEERQTPEICMHIKLPTLQSVERLMWLKSKRLRNWHTKRLAKHQYASGAVIHTIKKEGLQTLEYIDTAELIRYGELAKNIGDKKERIAKYTKNPKKHAKFIERVKDEIREIKDRGEINQIKIEANGDHELGVPNYPGRPSNYDYIDASQEYQRKKGLPDLLILGGDIVHDKIEPYYFPQLFQYAKVPAEIKQKIKDIRESEMPLKKKYKTLERVLKETVEQLPIACTDYAFKEFRLRDLPYIVDVIQNGGRIAIVSGNHLTKRKEGREEATMLGQIIKAAVPSYEGQVEEVAAIGQDFGSGVIKLEKENTESKKIFVAHRLWEGSDELIGAGKQMLRTNRDEEMVVYFHKHHPGIGFMDGTAYSLGAGMQTYSPYVHLIGKQDSLKGFLNIYTDPKKAYYKWEFILDPVLEKLMKR